MKRTTLLIPSLVACIVLAQAVHAASPSDPPLDSIDQRVLACTPCHGKEGRATNDGFYPRIAGKPAGYLFNQLLNFREGRRNFPMMTYLTERQRDDYLREIAAYFAGQSLPYPPPQAAGADGAALDRGRSLVMHGDPQQDVPACVACHGTRMLGVAPAVPGLLGLSREYLAAQLGAWRSGTRRAAGPDCMAEIVRRTKPEDLAAATAWLAAQEVPSPSLPEESFPLAPPLKCGSIRDVGVTP